MEIKKEVKNGDSAIRISVETGGVEQAHGWLYLIYNNLHKEPYAFLEDIFVEESARSQGLGNVILEALVSEAKARGCYKIVGTTRHSKPQVKAWYERHGLKDWGTAFRMDL